MGAEVPEVAEFDFGRVRVEVSRELWKSFCDCVKSCVLQVLDVSRFEMLWACVGLTGPPTLAQLLVNLLRGRRGLQVRRTWGSWPVGRYRQAASKLSHLLMAPNVQQVKGY